MQDHPPVSVRAAGLVDGGRRGEILALHYYHFDFETSTLNISHMKNNMFGLLPVSKEIMELVKRSAAMPE